MTTATREFGWGALAAWIAVTTLGWATGVVPMLLGFNHIWDGNRGDVILIGEEIASLINYCGLLLSTILIGGLVIGLGQQLILRSYLGSQIRQWLAVTLVGSLIGWSVGQVVSLCPLLLLHEGTPTAWVGQGVVLITVAGVCIGISQSRVLRPWVTAANQWSLETSTYPMTGGSAYWVLSTIIAWTGGGTVFWLVYVVVRPPMLVPIEPWPIYEAAYLSEYGPATLASWIAGGLVVGCMTGFAMKRLLTGATASQCQPPTPNP